MSYSSITFLDKNIIKRNLQRRRLTVALSTIKDNRIKSICDFGAGNGELLKKISADNAMLTCYEPSQNLMEEAKANLLNVKNVTFIQDINAVESSSMDYVFCLEVFEHLPEKETIAAIHNIIRILKEDGKLIVGVPVEIGFPAIYKGLFRLTRRRNTFDTKISNIVSSFMKKPPQNRPIGEISPGFNFHFDHMGFDYRKLNKSLKEYFSISKVFYSPFNFMSALMPEIYYEATLKKQHTK